MVGVGRKRVKTISFFILLIVTILWILPVAWGIGTSLKTANEIANNPISLIPNKVTFANFKLLFSQADTPVLRWMLNSFLIAITHTVLYVVIASLAAYAFSILKFKYRDTIFWLILGTTMIPGVINLVPLISMTIKFGWFGKWVALIVPGLGGVFGLFLMRQFFMGVPSEVIESAKMDGLSSFGVFIRMVLPLSKSVIMVAALFAFMGSWNDYMWPQIVMAGSDPKMLTLPIGLSQISGSYNYNYGLTMAAAIMSVLPVIVVYIFVQKHIIEGVSRTGLK